MPNSADALREIKTLDDLLPYLEDELDWPLQNYSLDDLTFEYEPAELGLKSEDAVRVRQVRQLRPLEHSQPWGIFFVEFEQKKLPVVVLRRILSHLVVKKRASSVPSQMVAWKPNDLLFISAFGDQTSDDREIAFAHFHAEAGHLPTLKVLGWDGGDTPLKLDHVAATLRDRLRWPGDTANAEAWRNQWSSAFQHRVGHVIRTSDALAEKLAQLARGVREAAITLMARETELGPLRRLHGAFRTALIHDLTSDQFADTYAQTITYGLLTAAISRTDRGGGRHGTVLAADDVSDLVPITNPFLKEMLETFLKAGGRRGGIDFDELGVQEVVDLLRGDETDLPAILLDFDNKNPNEDPVIHFYEHFLAAYDRKQKVQRGVFYTPRPVVAYIVRSVDELLRAKFGLADGLADTTTWREMATRHRDINIPKSVSPDQSFVQILDPATGTGTFLVEVIDLIHKTLIAKWKKQGHGELTIKSLWNTYVPKHLLPRLYGYELLMAPYAIAHLKLGLKLHETGYLFNSAERIRVYLTNALEPSNSKQLQFDFLPALAHEGYAVDEVKRNERFTVLIGNPPYSYMSANLTSAAAALIEPFRFVDGQRVRERSALSLERSLQDDFVKFLGLAIRQRQLTGPSFVLGMITNNSYLDSPLHRGLRGELTKQLTHLFITNLFGDSIKDREENIFDIQQGVAIILGEVFGSETESSVSVYDTHGTRASKISTLANTSWSRSAYVKIIIIPPQRYFLNVHYSDEYSNWPSLSEMFRITSTCIKTLKDSLATGFDADSVQRKIEHFRDSATTIAEITDLYGVHDVVQWKIEPARRSLQQLPLEQSIVEYQARPFDYRWMFYHRAIVGSPRAEVMNNLLNANNVALIANRRVRTGLCNHFWVTSKICVSEIISSADNSNCFPLYLIDDDVGLRLDSGLRSNYSSEFLADMTAAVTEDGAVAISPLEIFHYSYGVFHSPSYRRRYAELLRVDFPRLPMPGSANLFRELTRLGGQLVALHLLDSVDQKITADYEGPKNPQVVGVDWSADTVWLDSVAAKRGRAGRPGSIGFHGVSEDVWKFQVGGYQVCSKWLMDRRGRTLSDGEMLQFHRIVTALTETVRIMREVDDVVDQHGGWPGAFQPRFPGTPSGQ